MSDLFDFRMIRAPQRLAPRQKVDVYPEPGGKNGDDADATARMSAKSASRKRRKLSTAAAKDFQAGTATSRGADSFVKSKAFLGGGAALTLPLRELDEWLALHENRVAPARIEKFLREDISKIVKGAGWAKLRKGLADSLIAAMLADVAPSIRGELARLILIAALLEAIAKPGSTITTKDEVYEHLRWSTLVLPPALLKALPRSARLARRYGFSDYYVVRDEWSEYRAGEIAHIENVLAGEFRKREHTRTTEMESIETTDEFTSKSEEHDTQSTDRLEMSEHARDETSLAVHIEGKVDVSAQYGPAKIEAHVGGSFDYAHTEAKERATQFALETVARAVTKVEQQTRNIRSTRRLERYVERNLHRIDNTGSAPENISGIYRWVDKIQRLQVFGFPHRMLLEFEVPEPANFVRWRREGDDGDFDNPMPPDLVALDNNGKPQLDAEEKTRKLEPTDINELNYLRYAARYEVAELDPPPPPTTTVSASFDLKITEPPNNDSPSAPSESVRDVTLFDLVPPGGISGDGGIAVPSGYELKHWSVRLQTYRPVEFLGNPPDWTPVQPEFAVAVGQDVVHHTPKSPPAGLSVAPALDEAVVEFTRPAKSPSLTGSVPVTVSAGGTREFRAHVEFRCQRLRDHYVEWQLRCYETITATYQIQRLRHNEERAARAAGSGIAIEGDSPVRNAEVVNEELKRAVISLLSNGTYPPVDAMSAVEDPDTGPQLDLDFAALSAEAVQFLEQAFEWENMSYLLYPYYWAGKKRWRELADIQSADPVFDRFLRSGSARVVIPARPGFENQAQMYVDLGVLWGGGPVPAVGDPEYLSVAEEIKAQQKRPGKGDPGEWWDVKMPTTLVYLDSDSTLPKKNPAPTLGPPPPNP